MRRLPLLVLVVLSLPSAAFADEKVVSEDALVAAASRYDASTVRLRARQSQPFTGFYVADGTKVATAADAVGDGSRVEMAVEDGWKRAKLVGLDSDFGVAVFEAPVKGTPLEIDATADLEPGRIVLTAASEDAGGVDFAMVSSRGRIGRTLPHSAKGAPLLGPDGRVRGIVSGGSSDLVRASGNYFSLPRLRHAQPLDWNQATAVQAWPQLTATYSLFPPLVSGRRIARAIAELASGGKVRKAYLGLLLQDGKVMRVLHESPVAGKILPKDRIVGIDGRRYAPGDDVSADILALVPGTPVTLLVARPEIGEVAVEIVPAERQGSAAARGPAALGFEAVALTPEMRTWLGLGGDERGVMIAGVTPGGPAARAGLAHGQRLTRLAGRDVSSLEEVTAAVDDALRGLAAGEAVEAVVVENGAERTISLLAR